MHIYNDKILSQCKIGFGLFLFVGLIFSMSTSVWAGGKAKKSAPVENNLIISMDGPDGRLQCVELTKFNHSGWLKVNAFEPGGKTQTKHISIKPGQNVLNFTDQTVGKGMLSIDVIPKDAHIKLNGKIIEGSARGLFLPIGSHQVSFYRDGYLPAGRDIGISLCKASTLTVEMTRKAPIVKKAIKQKKSVKPIAVAPLPITEVRYLPGETFKDCSTCPEMIVIDKGSFTMGIKGGGIYSDAPLKKVNIIKPFAVSMFEVTFAQWDACVAAGGCNAHSPDDDGWGRKGRPVINVSWLDTQNYLDWASKKTGETYRLLSEAEWEYAARSGQQTSYWWGDELKQGQANCANCGSVYGAVKTAPVGQYAANNFGLFDTTGNVWEWVSDCYAPNAYKTHKKYPAPYASSKSCNHVLRGGAWDLIAQGATSHFRYNADNKLRSNTIGFRVARDL